MKEIYLIRHGQTDNNKLGKVQGGGVDSELNKIGIEQANFTGKYLKDYRLDNQFDVVYSSPLKRAKKTAEIICNKIGFDKSKIIIDNNLKEKDDGELSSGLTWAEMQKEPKFKQYFKIFEKVEKIKDPIDKWLHYYDEETENHIKKLYGTETHLDIINRIKKFIKAIKKSKAKKILVIAHNGSIYDMLDIMFNIGFSGSRKMNDFTYGSNCHITYIHQNKNNFQLITPPNTQHFAIYNKNYAK